MGKRRAQGGISQAKNMAVAVANVGSRLASLCLPLVVSGTHTRFVFYHNNHFSVLVHKTFLRRELSGIRPRQSSSWSAFCISLFSFDHLSTLLSTGLCLLAYPPVIASSLQLLFDDNATASTQSAQPSPHLGILNSQGSTGVQSVIGIEIIGR